MSRRLRRSMAAASGAPCTFPLDATEAECQALGATGKLTPSGGDQIGSYTIQSGLASAENYAMAPTGANDGTGLDIDVSSGIVAVGLNMDMMPDVGATRGTSTGDVFALLRFVDKTTLAIVAELQYGIDSSGPWISQNGSPFATTDGSQAAIYFDAVTGEWGFGYKDAGGVSQIESRGTFTSTNIVPILVLGEQPSVPAEFAGQGTQATFVSDAASITAPVPTGATDPCGNVIP